MEAQTNRVLQEIEAANGGLGAAKEIQLKGLSDLMKSEAFVYLGTEEGGAAAQQQAIEQYRRVMGMEPDAPTAAELAAMSPEDRALFEQ